MAFRFAKMIEHQVRGRLEDVVTQVVIVDDRRVASQKSKKRLLQKIVRRRGVAGHAKDVGPDPSGSLSVEGFEFRLVQDRKSTRLNSSHRTTSYAVFCLKKKT